MSRKHFFEQRQHAVHYILPYLQKHLADSFHSMNVLEVGCAEGGFLHACRQNGIQAVGLELESARIDLARTLDPNLNILQGDIADANIVDVFPEPFDLIVMRDVIEHIPEKDEALRNVVRLLSRSGWLYITFPPRFSPFGGHQQNGRSVLKTIPYLQLLPDRMLRFLGSLLREQPVLINHVIENYRIGLSIRHFLRLIRKYRLIPVDFIQFLVRPVYRLRFGISPVKLPGLPLLGEVLATGCEVLLRKR